MERLIPFQWQGKKVLLSLQVYTLFGYRPKAFENRVLGMRHELQDGVDCFFLVHDDLRTFKRFARSIGLPVNKQGRNLYLWTKSGVEKLFRDSSKPEHIQTLNDLLANYFDEKNPVQTFLHKVFGKLRTVQINNQPWFGGIDAARALGYNDAFAALKQHVPDKFKMTLTNKQMALNQETGESPPSFSGAVFDEQTMGGVQRLTFITEAGLYKLVFRSKLPNAEKFSDWICEVVIPSIREKGYYSADNAVVAEKDAKIAALEREVASLRGRLEKPQEDYVVYALLMDNDSVKIGMTQCLTKRIKAIRKETGLTAIKKYTTRFMPKGSAQALEAKIKEHFADACIAGEFFAIDFADACALIP